MNNQLLGFLLVCGGVILVFPIVSTLLFRVLVLVFGVYLFMSGFKMLMKPKKNDLSCMFDARCTYKASKK